MIKYLILTLLFTVSCQSNKKLDPVEANKAELLKKMAESPILKMSHWEEQFKLPITEKIFIANDDIINYITMDNVVAGYEEVPNNKINLSDYKSKIAKAIKTIPEKIKTKVNEKLIGIFLIKDLGGSGYTERVFDDKGNLVAGFIVLDIATLNKPANEWISWKENSPFNEENGLNIYVQIEAEKNNTLENAVQYILLHEFGHVISIGDTSLPMWGDKNKETEFTKISWELNSMGQFISKFETAFRFRKDIKFYKFSKFKKNRLLDVYQQLDQTDFVTLYGATNPYEDWAEAWVTYIHTKLQNKPYNIEIRVKNKPIRKIKLCWTEPRCAEKVKFVSNYFDNLLK